MSLFAEALNHPIEAYNVVYKISQKRFQPAAKCFQQLWVIFQELKQYPLHFFHQCILRQVQFCIVTILINSVFEPILHHFFGVSSPEIDFLNMLKITGIGILSYIIICFAFWVVCKCFGSKTTFTEHLSTWGISYFPTALCS